MMRRRMSGTCSRSAPHRWGSEICGNCRERCQHTIAGVYGPAHPCCVCSCTSSQLSLAAVRWLASLFTLAHPVQEEIQRRSRTGIVNKGSYHAPGAPPDEKEKPLFLRVVPGSDLPVSCH